MEGAFDQRERVAIDRVFIGLHVQVLQARRLVARIADAGLFTDSLVKIQASHGDSGLDCLALRLKAFLEVANVFGCQQMNRSSSVTVDFDDRGSYPLTATLRVESRREVD